jgi:hypothetical protein
LTANSLPPLVVLVDPGLAVPLAEASTPLPTRIQVIDFNPHSLNRHRQRPRRRIHSHRMRNRIIRRNALQRRPVCRHRRQVRIRGAGRKHSLERGGVEPACGCGIGDLVAAGDVADAGDDRTCGCVCDVAGCEAEG